MLDLTRREWIVFASIAAVLAITNVYTTLLTGWADGGSIIAVVTSVIVLRSLGQASSLRALNLGQTMASAGGTAGFSAAAYAAVRMADPTFTVSPALLILLFVATAIVGTYVGSALRPSFVRYNFPSGTACAVIQQSVTESRTSDRRSLRLLSISALIASVLTVPTKIGFAIGGRAFLTHLPLGTVRSQPLAISLDPLLFGIGLVVGPRIGGGLLLGSLAGAFAVPAWLSAGGVAPEATGDWLTWLAISILTVPTLVAIAFARVFAEPPIVPPGFEPLRDAPPATVADRRRSSVITALALALTVAITVLAFGVAWYWALLAALASGPLCLVNGRVTADVDINPVLLVVIAIMSAFALIGGMSEVMLLGLALIGSTMVGVAVDMMQDYRTGYLLGQDPRPQRTVQLVGVVIGVLVAVPFMLLLDAKLGFGPDAGLPAPGPRIYTTIASSLAGGLDLSAGLATAIAVVSLAASGFAILGVWPKTARFMPSLFALGLGLLLPIEMSAAIFAGGVLKVAAVALARRPASEASHDVLLVGAAVFCAAALTTVLLIALSHLAGLLGIDWIVFAG